MSNEQTDPSTVPRMLKTSPSGNDEAPKNGIASEFWLELKAYPEPDNKTSWRSLWLLVDGSWRRLDGPPANIESSVQSAFCNCHNRMAVEVWYRDQEIVGLVVRSR